MGLSVCIEWTPLECNGQTTLQLVVVVLFVTLMLVGGHHEICKARQSPLNWWANRIEGDGFVPFDRWVAVEEIPNSRRRMQRRDLERLTYNNV